ncbi:MAG: EAL domain-containing protein [Firmicutes bacterium]|nr:EAL domain-containing protein [Bacillota bacterium]
MVIKKNYINFFENNHAIMLIIDAKNQNIVDANNAACTYYGYTKHQFSEMKISDINTLSADSINIEINNVRLEEKTESYFKHRLANGDIRDVVVYSAPLGKSDRFLLSIIHDMTEKQNLEKELVLHKAYLEQLFNNTPNAIAMLNMNFRIININKRFQKLFGYRLDEIKGQSISEVLCSGKKLNESIDFIKKIKAGKVIRENSIRKTKKGKLVDVSIVAYPIVNDGKAIGVYVIYVEMTSKEERLSLKVKDELTGFYNRSYFINKFDDKLKNIQEKEMDKNKIFLMLINLNGLNRVNDNLGYRIRDMIIKIASERIEECISNKDILARIGETEFALLISNIEDKMKIIYKANNILGKFNDPFVIGDNDIYISTSIGISNYPNDGVEINSLMRRAHISMYKAKETSGNQFQIFAPEFQNKVREDFIIENNLRHAILNDEMLLNYQPIVNAVNGEIIGAEVLIRWRNKELGLVPPNKFICIAERMGTIVSIGEWVLKTACKQLKSWHDKGYKKIFMAINISIKQLEEVNFPLIVKEILDKTGLNSKYIEFEITETQYMKNINRIIESLKEISKLGINISIDDFGTGYSSLSQLSKLRINKLKIDRAFIKDIKVDITNTKIVETIILMARILNIKTVAEGVETIEQSNFLKENKCDMLQGYLYGKPVGSNLFQKMIDERLFK